VTVAGTHLDTRTAAYAAEVIAAIDATVPVLEAFVLGSAAAGGFDPSTSDLDLVVVIEARLAPAERHEILRRLQELEPPVRDLELVAYVAGAQPPDFELNVNHGEERPSEDQFWFVLDAALAQEHALPLLHGRSWSEFFEPVPSESTRRAVQESLRWTERQAGDEFARVHAVRARHYLDHGEWITKKEANR
jgi:predicted nucleotidyltransferase